MQNAEIALFNLQSTIQIGDVLLKDLCEVRIDDLIKEGIISLDEDSCVFSYDEALLSVSAGDLLTATHPCIMQNNYQEVTTKGSVYKIEEILYFDSLYFCIIDDEGFDHLFELKDLRKFFDIN